MKNSISIITATIFIAGTMFIGCQSSGSKVEDAQNKLEEEKEDVREARMDVNEAWNDSVTEYNNFKENAEAKLSANEKSIADFKTKIAKEKKETKAKYNLELDKLEKKNTELKLKLANYRENGKDKWDVFVTEFNSDMNEIGNAFKDLTVNNVK